MHRTTSNGVRIHFQVEGNGPPLVLLHGLGEDLNIWRELGYVDRLKERHRLLLIDLRGHGKSGKPRGSEFYKLKPMASDIVSVLDRVGIKKADLMGFSLGGWIGFGVAKYAPQRLRSLTVIGMNPCQTELDEDDLPQAVRAIGLPILLIVGQDDSFFVGAKTFAENSEKVKIVSYPLMGHFEPLIRIDMSLPYIEEFLKSV